MMATTHALAGLVLAAVAAAFVPEAGIVPVAAAALGGLFPDFDLYAGHRKTLHFPVYYAAAAAVASALSVAASTPATLSVALFLAAAALHSAMDAAGGGLELKPWEGTSERAVFSHFHGRWIAPRRWVRYDGAPEDLLLAVALAVPIVLAFEGRVEAFVAGALAVSAAYALLRKPLVRAGETLVDLLPPHLLDRLPARFTEDLR